MGEFESKIRAGLPLTVGDWNSYLIDAHRESPGMTSHAFAGHRTSEGLDSYETLAGAIDLPRDRALHLLDLGCGDGHFAQILLGQSRTPHRDLKILGIDMSPDEIALARKKVNDERVTFECAMAQALPLADSSIDAAYSHMAFMLMLPIEPVISELRRVLKPGAAFAALVGSPRIPNSDWLETIRNARNYLAERYPQLKSLNPGDPRSIELDGLGELFNARTGFSSPTELREIVIHFKRNKAEVWQHIAKQYMFFWLPENEKRELNQRVNEDVERWAEPDGSVNFSVALRLFTTTRM